MLITERSGLIYSFFDAKGYSQADYGNVWSKYSANLVMVIITET